VMSRSELYLVTALAPWWMIARPAIALGNG
jgi:hypothetical protein